MKIILIFLIALNFSFLASAQDPDITTEREEDERKGFQKDRLFTGGGITLSFSSDVTAIGVSPVFGYSITNWLDAGVVLNYVYLTQRNYAVYSPDDKLRQTTIGPGAFVRIFPVPFLFAHVQYEKNFTKQTLIPDNDAFPRESIKVSAPSILLGAGYAAGREEPGNMFYHISILFDVRKHQYSPYVQQTQGGKVNVIPFIKAGIQIPLFQGR